MTYPLEQSATWPKGETLTVEPEASNTFVYRHATTTEGHVTGQIFRRLDDGLWHQGVVDMTSSAITWGSLSGPTENETDVRIELLAVPPTR